MRQHTGTAVQFLRLVGGRFQRHEVPDIFRDDLHSDGCESILGEGTTNEPGRLAVVA